MKIVAKPFTVLAMAKSRHDGDEAAQPNQHLRFCGHFYHGKYASVSAACICRVSTALGNCGYTAGISLYSIRIFIF